MRNCLPIYLEVGIFAVHLCHSITSALFLGDCFSTRTIEVALKLAFMMRLASASIFAWSCSPCRLTHIDVAYNKQKNAC